MERDSSERAAYLERRTPTGIEMSPLADKELAMGTAPENSVVFDDPTVSHLHAVLERFGGGWTVRDLGSRNGTFVNGQRISGSRALRDGDEIRVGETSLLFHAPRAERKSTRAAEPAPDLTRRERDVLRALCRPLASGDVFTEPASMARIAAELVVTEEAVKQHLRNLYGKFGLVEPGDRRRRVRLANEAIRRGAIGLGELRA